MTDYDFDTELEKLSLIEQVILALVYISVILIALPFSILYHIFKYIKNLNLKSISMYFNGLTPEALAIALILLYLLILLFFK